MERRLRIGELGARTGISPDLLRAWERRYDLLEPVRSDGGYRLYSASDEERVRAMARHIEAGTPAGEAARLVLAGQELTGSEAGWLPELTAELRRALDNFDEAATQSAFDSLIAKLSFEAVARDVILPLLRELGERWERGEASVAQEHFASNVIRGRLLALSRDWDRGVGPRAILACAPGERHELGLLVFGLALRRYGWRITYLGADTPIDSLTAGVHDLSPAAVVLIALDPERLRPPPGALVDVARRTRLLIGGAGAQEELVDALGAELISGDPLEAAKALAIGSPKPA